MTRRYAIICGTTVAPVSPCTGMNSTSGSTTKKPSVPRTTAIAPTNAIVWPATLPTRRFSSAPVYWATRMLPAVVNPPAIEIDRKTIGNPALIAATAVELYQPR